MNENIYAVMFNGFIQPFSSSSLLYLQKSDARFMTGGKDMVSPALNGLTVDDGIKNFYQMVEFMIINWQIKDDAGEVDYIDAGIDIIQGELNILPFEKMITGLDEEVYRAATSAVSVNRYFPFDYIEAELAVCFATNQNNHVSDRLHLVDFYEKDKIIDLNITIHQYLKAAFQNKFFFLWQYAHYGNDKTRKRQLENYVPQLFK